jgi:putative DNA primase/helicase
MADIIDYPSKSNGFKDSKSWQYYELAHYMVNEMGLKSIDSYMWIYKDTHYVPINRKLLSKIIIQLTNEAAAPKTVRSFVEACECVSQLNDDEFKSPKNCINLANGVLDIKSKIFVPHNKDFNFKYMTPIKYDPKARCDEFLEFLNFVFEGDAQLLSVTAEIFGYCLLDSHPFLHKAFVLLGQGRNGKSTFLDVLKKLLGEQNVASVSLSNLDRPFSVVQLDGKLANIVGETPDKHISSELFKTAIGGEELTAALKNKNEYSMPVNARFVVAANKMPKFGDTTTGMWEKLFILPFNRYIPEGQRDKGKRERLFKELPGILNFALSGLDRLMENKSLTKVDASQMMVEDYREDSDSFYEFFNQVVVINKKDADKLSSGDFTHLKVIYNAYVKWCERNSVKYPIGLKECRKRLSFILRERGLEHDCPYQRTREGYAYGNVSIRDFSLIYSVKGHFHHPSH